MVWMAVRAEAEGAYPVRSMVKSSREEEMRPV